jgi:hypothetical protein
MKITKILLVALSLMLFSCTQEEDVTVSAQSKLTKSGGLTPTEVESLKRDAEIISQSSEFLAMRVKAKEFAVMLNHTTPDFSSLQNFESWVNLNVGLTKFATKADCMQMLGELKQLTGIYLAANETFFKTLSGATLGQYQIILLPINPPNPIPVTNSSCDDDCFADAAAQDDFAFRAYESHLDAIVNNPFYTSEQAEWAFNFAEASLNSTLDNNTYNLNLCLDAC